MKQLKGILNVATGFKGIKESTHKSQINNKKNTLVIKYDHPLSKYGTSKNKKQVRGRKKQKKCVGKKMKNAVAFQKIRILMCAVQSFMNYC